MTTTKPILSIDPGTTESAYLLWNGTIESMGIKPNQVVLSMVRDMAARGCFYNLAVEMIASYGMAVGAETFQTVLWIGRFVEAWESRGGISQLVYRLRIKQHLCHDSRAKDANIRQAILDRFGGRDRALGKKASPGPLYGVSSHLWSALAVALTAYDMDQSFRNATTQTKGSLPQA